MTEYILLYLVAPSRGIRRKDFDEYPQKELSVLREMDLELNKDDNSGVVAWALYERVGRLYDLQDWEVADERYQQDFELYIGDKVNNIYGTHQAAEQEVLNNWQSFIEAHKDLVFKFAHRAFVKANNSAEFCASVLEDYGPFKVSDSSFVSAEVVDSGKTTNELWAAIKLEEKARFFDGIERTLLATVSIYQPLLETYTGKPVKRVDDTDKWYIDTRDIQLQVK